MSGYVHLCCTGQRLAQRRRHRQHHALEKGHRAALAHGLHPHWSLGLALAGLPQAGGHVGLNVHPPSRRGLQRRDISAPVRRESEVSLHASRFTWQPEAFCLRRRCGAHPTQQAGSFISCPVERRCGASASPAPWRWKQVTMSSAMPSCSRWVIGSFSHSPAPLCTATGRADPVPRPLRSAGRAGGVPERRAKSPLADLPEGARPNGHADPPG